MKHPPPIHSITTTVTRVWEHTEDSYVSGFGKETIFAARSRGWFVSFSGSYEGIFFGDEKPPLAPGDVIRIEYHKLSPQLKDTASEPQSAPLRYDGNATLDSRTVDPFLDPTSTP